MRIIPGEGVIVSTIAGSPDFHAANREPIQARPASRRTGMPKTALAR